MLENFREFEAGPDPFGDTWKVRFGWLQTAIAIRHSDSVDVKFFLTNGRDQIERVVAIMHPDLLELSRELERPLTDAWVMKLAALHLKHMVETGEDFEKTLVTVTRDQLRRYAQMLEAAGARR
jgi:hypothetical protein